MCVQRVCEFCQMDENFSCADCQENNNKRKGFSAQDFVEHLLTKGSIAPCDETADQFNNNKLPPYYDEEMYIRGQKFFHKHIFGMFLGNLLGLMAGLSIQSSLAVLIMTKMSGSDYTAYKRYVSTILHMMIWYDSDFKPGSRLWKSLENVKQKHNSASKKSMCVLKYRINQKDMALAQFGFMGLIVTRNQLLGIHDMNDDELECFLHVWRVIGYVLGMEEQYNLCRKNIDETKAICHEILTRVITPTVEEKQTNHLDMVNYLINGLRTMNPFLETKTFMFYMRIVLNNDLTCVGNNDLEYRLMSNDQKFRLRAILLTIKSLQYSLVRILLNSLQWFSVWIIKTYPYLAFYKFGKANSYVNIMRTY
ncbi:uncharacterized protein LOC115884641 isoform X2 [Sitophilus oryzae]|uniref:Uncharacterized protein LOC115884641 isoform X2 n=1 Tax=Sitophilus oryzae TaxID=7048 RepID=A0A6J2Y5Q1_SITOR|nr:uncharacterized protein LOC115884641 isoform X2 [Sitophilus oryzae]